MKASAMKILCRLAVLCFIVIVTSCVRDPSLTFKSAAVVGSGDAPAVIGKKDLEAVVDGKDEIDASCAQEASLSLLQNKLEVLPQGGSPTLLNTEESVLMASSTVDTAGMGQIALSHDAPNVLFLVADDLRPMISSLKADQLGYMHTPNLDALVKESLVLTNSNAQQAICTPSRASVLFGRRPDTMHVWQGSNDHSGTTEYDPLRGWCTQCVSIPGLFKEAGYATVGVGKVFGGNEPDPMEDPQSWSYPEFAGDNWFDPGTRSGETHLNDEKKNSWLSVDETVVGQLEDSQVRDHALSLLRNLTRMPSGKPWLLAVGFHKPHHPLIAPQQFFDLYDVNSSKLADNPFVSENMPPIAHRSFDLLGYDDIKAIGYGGAFNETLPDWKAKQLVRAYQACVSYFDYNVGILLTELKILRQWSNTIIVLWSDHGYKLGQHGAWGKDSNSHDDTNSPVILRVPGLTDTGVSSHALVEHVDIMPTLLEAAGLNALPTCPEQEPWRVSYCTEGRSFLRLALSPGSAGKNASYSQTRRKDYDVMGYSMQTNTGFRFTAWVDFDPHSQTTNWTMYSKECAFELYDQNVDPMEKYNRAYESQFQVQVQDLSVQLKLGWRVTAELDLTSE